MTAALVAGIIPATAQAQVMPGWDYSITVLAHPNPPPVPLVQPGTTIQQLVDAAAPGSIVEVPPGLYRETVTINKPITLSGRPGSEIRGSDNWSSGWRRNADYWVRGTLPEFNNGHGSCQSSVGESCKWQEQVFLDGQPLDQVESNPQTGQFAVNSRRQVVLADDPAGHLVEVTVREHWVIGEADNVTVEGFTMQHAAVMAQHGAITNGGHSGWTIQNNTLSHAHGANVSLSSGQNLKLLNNTISFAGQLGVHGFAGADVLVQGNRIYNNNAEGYQPKWEAGGLKMVATARLVLDGNEVFNNDGPGLWCDIDCNDTIIRLNRVHNNAYFGINYEISAGAKIHDNIVWENGYKHSDWGWGAGILVQNSSDVEVFNNTVAWNADGISVISQDRGEARWNAVSNNNVHDNSIFTVRADEHNVMTLVWLQDWEGSMAAPDSNNRGTNNRYYHSSGDDSPWPFGYVDQWFPYGDLAGFNTTPGGNNGSYMNVEQKDQSLSSVGVPTEPERGR
jgi:parallel beta-helix repeat protein